MGGLHTEGVTEEVKRGRLSRNVQERPDSWQRVKVTADE